MLSSVCEQLASFLFVNNLARRVEEAEPPDGIQPDLASEDLPCFGFAAPAYSRPAHAGQAGFLHLIFSVHGGCSPNMGWIDFPPLSGAVAPFPVYPRDAASVAYLRFLYSIKLATTSEK
jgi:hypothetical protein